MAGCESVLQQIYRGMSSSTHDMLTIFDSLAKRVSPYIPYTAPYQVRTTARVPNGWSILDLGCGRGEKAALFRRPKCSITGVDRWLPYLQECRGSNACDNFVICDVRQLPFREKSFDLIICLELLEHLNKDQASKLLEDMERIAKRRIVLSLPVGTHIQHAYDDNPYQEHLSSWAPSELRSRGYKVRVNGIRGTVGETGIGARISPLLSPLWRIFGVLVGPVVNLLPQLGGHMVCNKELAIELRG